MTPELQLEVNHPSWIARRWAAVSVPLVGKGCLALLAVMTLGVSLSNTSGLSNWCGLLVLDPTQQTLPLAVLPLSEAEQIASHVAKNEKLLTRGHGSQTQLDQCTEDLSVLLAIQDAPLENSVAAQCRQIYASTLENRLQQQLIRAYVTTLGEHHQQLVINYGLMNAAMVRRFETASGLPDAARAAGFTSVLYVAGLTPSTATASWQTKL